MSTIEARDLTVIRGGRPVLTDVDFRVEPGELVGLVGPSGSGKTTLMRAIVGVQRDVTGTLTVLGKPAGVAELRRRVAYVTQAPSVYSDLTVMENLRFFAAVLGLDADEVRTKIDAVDLGSVADRRVDELSGGQRARASLATALLGRPELLVLDEPTVGLDPVLREELWRQFHELAQEGRALLVSSHVMDEAARCDRVLLMRDGRILADSTPDGLLRTTGAADLDAAFLRLVEAGASR